MANKAVNEFAARLANLLHDSKTLMYILTSLAEEYAVYAAEIVTVVEEHLKKVEPSRKLLTIYLIDSIVRKLGGIYTELFQRNIAQNFCSVYEEVDTECQFDMIRLRKAWNGLFPSEVLRDIDRHVREPELVVIPIILPYRKGHEDDWMKYGDESFEFANNECKNIAKRYRNLKISPLRTPQITDERLIESSMKKLSLETGQSSTMDGDSRLWPVLAEEETLTPLSSPFETAQDSDQIVLQSTMQQHDYYAKSSSDKMTSDVNERLENLVLNEFMECSYD
ncbi:hypothetical protein WA026_015268 [Henosepilachna vigintioctopunctata]|uniref:CID domain-containing protein n=1 Tax=Henosepilachna vigintioctopunctata TaxID=420089 RepID=A0AAW1TNX0_9CUCU